MNNLIRALLVTLLLFAMMAGLVCSFVLAGDVNVSEGGAGNQTIESGAINSMDNENEATGGDGEGGSVEMNSAEYSPSFSAANGQDSVQVGSLIFGSITVSKDTRSSDLRRNLGTVISAQQAGLIDKETAKENAQFIVEELKKESKPSKCFGFIPCGKDRKITNLFKLL